MHAPVPENLTLEHRPCLCGADDAEPVFSGGDALLDIPGVFHVVRCRRCGLYYVDPRPDARSIAAFYPSDYLAFRKVPADTIGIMNEGRGMIDRAKNAVKRALLEQWYGYPSGGKASRRSILRKSLLAPFWPDFYAKYYRIIPFVPGGKVLDAGCGNASYLYLLRKMGWDVRGVEMDPGCCRYAKDEYGIEVFNGQLSDAPYVDGSFDAVTMWHFLEHTHEPRRVLERGARLLKKNGFLVVGVPNAAGLEARALRGRSLVFDVPRHLYGFTPAVLKGMLRREGLAVEKVVYLEDRPLVHSAANRVLEDLKCRLRLPTVLFTNVVARFAYQLLCLLGQSNVFVVYARKG